MEITLHISELKAALPGLAKVLDLALQIIAARWQVPRVVWKAG